MENYISLERLRLNEEIPIRLKVEGGNAEDYLIAPLIFITFLENAFKHGVSNNHPQAWVDVSILLSGNECVYRVQNSKKPFAKTEAEQKSGIGLQNVKRRLALSYPGKHSLVVDDGSDKYSVQLKIQLN